MSFTKEQVAVEIGKFFDRIQAAVVDQATSKTLPLIGAASALPGADAITAAFETLKGQLIDAIIASLPSADSAQAVVDAINAVDPGAIVATKTGDGGIEIRVLETKTIETGEGAIDTGDLGFLELAVSTGATIKAVLDTTIAISPDGDLTLKDQAAPELAVDVTADLSLTDFVTDLGVVHVRLSDADPLVPELAAHFDLDLDNGAGGTITVDPTLTASAKLDLNFESTKGSLPIQLLPDIDGHLVIDYPISDDPTAAPTVSVDHITVDLKSYLGIVGETAQEVGDLFNAGALSKIVDIATAPIPVLDDIAHVIPGLLHQFDQVGSISGGSDNKVSLGDLVVGMQPDEKQLIGPFYQLLAIINILRKIDSVSDVGTIDFGGGTRAADGTLTSTADPTVIADSLKAALKDKVPGEIFDYLTNLIDSDPEPFVADGMSALAVGPSRGFSFGLLDNPASVLTLLFSPATPVDLVKFDVPALTLGDEFHKFFPVLGPLGFELGGHVGATIDIDVGYDSKGLGTGQIEDGFFFSTPGGYINSHFPEEKFAPAGSLTTGLFGGAGLGFGFGEVTVRAGFDFGLYAFLGGRDAEGKFRPSIDPIGCIFSPIEGTAGVSVKLHFEIGFGPFSVTKNVPLAEAKLADFNVFKCPPPTAVPTPDAPGLATIEGANTLLNVGERADLRKVADRDDGVPHQLINDNDPRTPDDDSFNEGYIIGRARNTDDDGVTTVDGTQLDILAFGVTQRVTANGVIRADFTNGIDELIIQSDVMTPADVHGGGGDDLLIGGAGADILHGDGEEDVLEGHDGNDQLFGGDMADQLSGGKGADTLDGGDGIDTVDYSQANRDVMVGVTIALSNTAFTASGGDATGDVLTNIENVVGTDYNDTINADGADFKTYLEGGEGGDYLGGGNESDYLQGGAGGDYIDGRGGEDATTYVFSWAGVDIDLNRYHQIGGDAQDDVLVNLEDIQGTVFDDRMVGNGLNNIFDAGSGNDTLDGGGGTDSVLAGDGDDYVYGRGDGDLLDGSNGLNTLSYELATVSVNVDLGLTEKDDDFSNAPDRIVMRVQATNAFRGISTFANLTGSAFADTLSGDVTDNHILGGAGADSIDGWGGFDHLVGGAGADTIDGGTGIDWVEYDDSFLQGVQVNLSGLAANAGGTAQGDIFTFDFSTFGSTVENVLGSRYGDTLTGSAVDNIINPNIYGKAVTETVDGGGGTDTLQVDYSSAPADVGRGVTGGFFGTSHNGTFTHYDATGVGTLDTVNYSDIEQIELVGTRYADIVYGGRGDDRIVTGAGNDSIFAGEGADVVKAGRGDDGVLYGFTVGQQGPVIGVAAAAVVINTPQVAPLFSLNGGAGIDTLSISLAGVTEDVRINGGPGDGTQYFGTNLRLSSGGAAYYFEKLAGVATGMGNDSITQYGAVDNYFISGDGHDTITPGLGRDYVDGGFNTDGLTPVTVDGNGRSLAEIVDFAKVIGTPGDTLVLDYSSLSGDQRLISANASVFSLFAQTTASTYFAQYEVDTNIGRYVTVDTELYGDSGFPQRVPTDSPNDLVYTGIERLDVTGSNRNDFIVGTERAMSREDTGQDSPGGGTQDSDPRPSVTGGDILRGLDGDDLIFGGSGNDVMDGGAGDDFLQGAGFRPVVSRNPVASDDYDAYEMDTLTGGEGADTFVVGVNEGVLYEDFGFYRGFYDNPGRAIITDFDADEGDTIQLYGDATQYRLEETATGTTIRYINNREYADDERVAEVRGIFGLTLDDPAFTYLGGASGRGAASANGALLVTSEDVAACAALSRSLLEAVAPVPVDAALPAAIATKMQTNLVGDPFTVVQQSDAGAFKAMIDAATGASATSLSLSGSAEAFGTFVNDPFGLGKGIILSTGIAEDLPGKNTAESGGSNLTSIPVTFTKIGTSGGNTIFRADLSGLNIDLRSIKLSDSGSLVGGSGGEASGFDLAAVALSTKFIANATALNLDDPAVLPKLDVFDFSSAGITFGQGTQREPTNTTYLYQENVLGAVNTDLVDQTLVRFDSFGSVPPPSRVDGALTLGDGGSIGFDLTQSVSTDGPLYLYIAEAGISTETVTGTIDVSGDTIAPTGDLSTDLGAPGLTDDATSMTYRFTPKAGDTAFSMNVVLFTEELPEFDGTKLTDLFSIKLNGIEIGALNNGNALSIKALALSPNDDIVFNDPGIAPLADIIKADAYTHTLVITGPLISGADNVLTIEAKDGRDAYLDSGLLIQSDSFKTFVGEPIIDVTPPVPLTDPLLIFERLSGDVAIGFTVGNDVIDGTARPGPTTFYEPGLASGKDTINGFGKTDILIVDMQVFDSNNDGVITFGRNGVLDLDGAEAGKDTIRFTSGPKAMRLIGTDDDGHWVYADGSVRPKSTKEGTLADDMLTGGAGDKKKDIFLFDTNLDVNWGRDKIANFGAKDFLVTTSRLYDADNDGKIALSMGKLALSGNSYFDAAHGGNVSPTNPFGDVTLTDTAGASLQSLAFDGTINRGGVLYYVYSQTYHSITDSLIG
ncbi:choice-of-anchor L domain-containing protein [Sphingomonas sp. PB2P19]|uniref:choice-of-anchor L domain-containing protein n=1 Tax=Sphingomonas rhamnosi TaxID=3096156 RepID=UPI002FC5F45F